MYKPQPFVIVQKSIFVYLHMDTKVETSWFFLFIQ